MTAETESLSKETIASPRPSLVCNVCENRAPREETVRIVLEYTNFKGEHQDHCREFCFSCASQAIRLLYEMADGEGKMYFLHQTGPREVYRTL